MRRLLPLATSLLFISILASNAMAQSAPAAGPSPSPLEAANLAQPENDALDPRFGSQADQIRTPANQRAEALQQKERQKQRWLEIKKESEKLLEVATELKQYVDKAGENVVSLEVVKKAEQMEKLSKDLQKHMKSTY